MLASSIILYVSTFIYFVLAATFFSLDNTVYWMFVIYALLSLYDGILISSLRNKVNGLTFEKKDQIAYIVYTVISTLGVASLILNLIALFRKKEDSYEIVKIETEKPQKKEKKQRSFFLKGNFITLCISLVTILIASFSAMCFETSGFTVNVSDFRLTKKMTEEYNGTKLNGKSYIIANDELSYSITMYKPKTASVDNKLPTIFVMPGFTRTKATMAQYCIELSRRGAVVFSIDPGAQGGTTYAGYNHDDEGNIIVDANGDKSQISATTQSNGLNYLVQYLYNNTEDYPFLDRDRFGAVGHSAGGGNVGSLAEAFAGATYQESIIKSLYVSGYIKTSLANRFKNFNCNAALSYAYYDEGAFRYQGDVTAFETISLRFINEIQGNNLGYEDVVFDYGYGDMEQGTYRIVHNEMINHCFEMYDATSISNTVNFFNVSLKMGSTISPRSQIWMGKEASNGIALAMAMVMIVSLSSVLISLPFFKKAKRKLVLDEEYAGSYEVPTSDGSTGTLNTGTITVREKLANDAKKTHDKIIFWTTMIITAIVACLDYIPLAWLSIQWLPDAASNTYTFLFPARMVNAVLFWAVTNGTFGLVLFFGIPLVENLYKVIKGKIKGETVELDWSKFKLLKIDWKQLLITILMAVIMFVAFYGMVQICYWIFHQDFRFFLISAAPLNARFFVTWLMYVPLFFIFYVSNSIRVNASIATRGYSEWKVFLISAIANSIGLCFILVINYVAFFMKGAPFYGYFGDPKAEVWLYINMVFGIIPLMMLLPILNRIFFKQTNNVYLGPLVTSMIFIMMTLSASVSYIPM